MKIENNMPAGKLVFFKRGVDFDLGCEEYGILAACQEAGIEEVKSWYGVMSSEFYIRTDIDLIVRVYESSDPSVRPTIEILPTLPMREVLEDLKQLLLLTRAELDDGGKITNWDDSTEPTEEWRWAWSGFKRTLYSLWHEGENERGDYMLWEGTPNANKFHKELIDKWSVFPEPTIRF